MKSTSGKHFLALDQLRAIAALLVVVWHFIHTKGGIDIPHSQMSDFPLMSIFLEGHTGVSMFMVLSGYLFARLISGNDIRVPAFLWNRALRLLPLLLVVVAIVAAQTHFSGKSVRDFLIQCLKGVALPTLPNGGWSITVEFHFYLLLPFLLAIVRRSALLMLCFVALGLLIRSAALSLHGDAQTVAYWTILGRIDQFSVGMFAALAWPRCMERIPILASIVAGFVFSFWLFDRSGGYYPEDVGSNAYWWVILPTIEAFGYSAAIRLWEQISPKSPGVFGRGVAYFGELSYSMYLLHYFFVAWASIAAAKIFGGQPPLVVALLLAMIFYLMMVVPCALSLRLIERPALKFRRPYLVPSTT